MHMWPVAWALYERIQENWSRCQLSILYQESMKECGDGTGSAINMACTDPRGCIKGVLIVTRGYKIYTRYVYY